MTVFEPMRFAIVNLIVWRVKQQLKCTKTFDSANIDNKLITAYPKLFIIVVFFTMNAC